MTELRGVARSNRMNRALVACCLLLGLAGCAAKPRGVRIFAAVSTTEALGQIAREFETQTGIPISPSFAASSTLARQIELGADADLFLSADERWADYLAEKGLVAERRDLLANRLVVVTSADRPLNLRRLADLAGADIRHLALALEPVPAGRYARQALKNAGIWPQFQERIREAGDVRATLALVTRSEAEAGLVYATDAAAAGDKVRVALQVSEKLHAPIRYPLVLLSQANDRAARAFYDFLDSEAAKRRFHKAGFQIQIATDEHR